MRVLAVLLAVVLWAASATAGTWTGPAVFKSAESATYVFTAADGTGGDSNGFRVDEGTVLVCLDPNPAGTTVGGATITVRRCLGGAKPSSNPQNVCVETGGATAGSVGLDGTGGDPVTTQNACMSYGAGWYYIDVLSACTAASCTVSLDHLRVR